MACLLFRLNGRVLVMLCGFQCVKDACYKTRHPSVAEGFPYTLPTSAYTAPAVRRRCPSAFPKAFACFDRLNTSLGRSLPFGLAVGCLLHCWRASNGLLCSAYPFRPCFVYDRMNPIVSISSVTRLSNLDPSNPFCLNSNINPISFVQRSAQTISGWLLFHFNQKRRQ